MFNYSASNLSRSPLIDEHLRRELGGVSTSKNNGSPSKVFPVLVKFKKGDVCYQNGMKSLQNIINNFAHCKMKRSLSRFSLQSGNFSAAALEDLCKNCGDIEKVYLDREVNALLDTATDTTRSSELQKATGATGKDVTIAIVDTGVYPSPDLMEPEERIIGFKDFVNDREDPYDDNGHGTHCAGDAASNGHQSDGKYAGPAPEANIVGVKVLNSMGSGSLSDIMAGLDWCMENKDEYNIRILSLSFGSPGTESEDDDPMVQAVNHAWDEGLVVCVAAGNEGPGDETISSPGISQKIITVGALDDKDTSDRSDDDVAEFSSRGPTIDGHTKPDILAPGVNIVSLRAPNAFLDEMSKNDQMDDHYIQMSGTSMATPICAGVCAQMLELNNELKPDEVKNQILERAKDMGFEANTQGKGSLDAIGNSDKEDVP